MHELSIALGIVEIGSEEAQRHMASSVTAVHIRLGPLSGVAREALESAFELAREHTLLANARLVIQETEVIAHCPRCASPGRVVAPAELRCIRCGSLTTEVLGGNDFELRAMEITT